MSEQHCALSLIYCDVSAAKAAPSVICAAGSAETRERVNNAVHCFTHNVTDWMVSLF